MSLLKNDQQAESPDKNGENRMNEKTRASIWLALAVAVFLFTVVTCLSLIRKSAETSPSQTVETYVQNIKYVNAPTQPDEGEEEPGETIEHSAVLNYLVAARNRETEQTDAIMILNVNTTNATAALLSIPKDTYVSGGYEVPKANRVYGSYEQSGAEALAEAAGDMLGFDLNGYVIFDEASLEAILTELDGITFDIPAEPDYHTLPTGTQTFSDGEAFGIFCYREDYTEIETDSTQVQRTFLLRILDKLVEAQQKTAEYAKIITESTETNLSEDMLIHLAQILKDFDFEAAYENSLPGKEIHVDEEDYFEVDEEKACEYLNEYFNPLEEALTQSDLQFRQKHDDSGIGVDSDWNNNTTARPTQDNTEPTESTDDSAHLPNPTEETSQDDEPTEPTDDGELLPEPTEESSQDDTPEPTENPDPLEPAEPDGDE